jgi:hypothetical protein
MVVVIKSNVKSFFSYFLAIFRTIMVCLVWEYLRRESYKRNGVSDISSAWQSTERDQRYILFRCPSSILMCDSSIYNLSNIFMIWNQTVK